jgi:hypothetical protein
VCLLRCISRRGILKFASVYTILNNSISSYADRKNVMFLFELIDFHNFSIVLYSNETQRFQYRFHHHLLACFFKKYHDIIMKNYGLGVNSASNRNEYEVYFLGVKAVGA